MFSVLTVYSYVDFTKKTEKNQEKEDKILTESTDMTFFSELSFTPSEYMLLNGDQFSEEDSGVNCIQLLCSDHSVNGPILAAHMLVAAILANEADGGLTLGLELERKPFSPKPKSMHLQLRSPRPRWSGMTLEDSILNIVSAARSTQGDNTLGAILKQLFSQKQVKPWLRVIELVEWGLASNNWLIPVEGGASSAFTTPFVCPAHVARLAIAQPAEPVMQLLTECRTNRPEVWTIMRDEIARALRA